MILRFSELQSTNSYLKENYQGKPQFTVVTADFQTAGRGQRGNSWESERGKNLLFSMLFYPTVAIPPMQQFQISKAVAVGTVEALEELLQGVEHPEVCIKWPNDIYIGNRKVAGILIENSLAGADRIDHSIIGIGLNVNQREFRSNAPNPGSLIQYLGEETDLVALTVSLRDHLAARLTAMADGELDAKYKSLLWRRTGFHPYISLKVSAAPAPTAVAAGDAPEDNRFEAEIVDVAADGRIFMRLRSGAISSFYFKEITPILG